MAWIWILMGLVAAGAAGAAESPAARSSSGPGDDVAVIRVPQGAIVVKFFEHDAPKTVENFKKLTRSGFYDGTTFHRLVPGFVIQGGDPNSKDADLSNDGTGHSDHTIPGEFSKTLKHVRGTLSMARSADPNSASCQFFVCLAPAPSLDGKYAAFGQVIQGMDVVDKIAALANSPSTKQGPMGANPGKKAMIQKVTLESATAWVKPAAKPAPTAAKSVAKPVEPTASPPQKMATEPAKEPETTAEPEKAAEPPAPPPIPAEKDTTSN